MILAGIAYNSAIKYIRPNMERRILYLCPLVEKLPNNEKEWCILISDGDEAAFRQLFHYYVPIVLPVIEDVIGTEAAAKDVVQEVFLRIWLSRDKLPEIVDLRAWIFRIVYNHSYSWLRAKASADQARLRLLDKELTNPGNRPIDDPASLSETSRLIHQAVGQLTPQEKKIYQLSRDAGMKPAEIARQLGLSSQTVRNTLSRALKNIRDYLLAHGIAIPLFLLCYPIL